jgi:hypothetical protein
VVLSVSWVIYSNNTNDPSPACNPPRPEITAPRPHVSVHISLMQSIRFKFCYVSTFPMNNSRKKCLRFILLVLSSFLREEQAHTRLNEALRRSCCVHCRLMESFSRFVYCWYEMGVYLLNLKWKSWHIFHELWLLLSLYPKCTKWMHIVKVMSICPYSSPSQLMK